MPEAPIDESFEYALRHHHAGRLGDAEPIYRRIVVLAPDYADAIHLLGVAGLQSGRLQAALKLIERAINLYPEVATYRNNLGQVLQALGHNPEAESTYRRAIKLDPNYAEAYNNLGIVLEDANRLQAAIACYAASIGLNPGYASPYTNLGNALKVQGEIDQAIIHYRRAAALQPSLPAMQSNLLLSLHYQQGQTTGNLASEHRQWALRYGDMWQDNASTLPDEAATERRLRIGYVSPDFREHPVARFILPLLSAHDRSRFAVICYSDCTRADSTTEQVRKTADEWREIAALDDAGLAHLIKQDRIDILVDLAGHTSRHRLLTFAQKPAPIQVTYLGYPNTTGLSAIDYRVVDRWSDPDTALDQGYSEKLWRLPRTAWCYRPPGEVPDTQVRAAAGEHPFNFGSFNTLAKLSPSTVEMWSQILARVPQATLTLKAKALADESARQRILARFEKFGIPPGRLILQPWTKSAREHWALYHQIDLALDSFPYHGTTTTCEAMWMGVPVVTLAGTPHHSRVGVSLLKTLGLDCCIARSAQHYVEIAVGLAQTPRDLQVLRAGLREKMRYSALCDEKIFARDFEDALTAMWRTKCASLRREV